MTAWAVIVAVGLGSYAMRAVMFVVMPTTTPSPRAARALALVGPAAAGAVLASMALTHDGAVEPLPFVELVAVASGFVAVRRTGNVLHAFTVGLPVLWLLRALGV